jgi:hypothetical protein
MGILESLFGYQNDPMAQSLTPEQSDTLRGNNIQNLGLAFLKASNTTQGDAPGFGSVLANALGGYGELKNRGLADFVQKQQVLSDINQKQKVQELQDRLVNDPQFANDPTAQLLAQSSPGVLGQYLAGQNKANSPMFEKVGNQVVKIDPATGEAAPVYTAPEEGLSARDRAELGIQRERLALEKSKMDGGAGSFERNAATRGIVASSVKLLDGLQGGYSTAQDISDSAQGIVDAVTRPGVSVGPGGQALSESNKALKQIFGVDFGIQNSAAVEAAKQNQQNIIKGFVKLYGGRGFTDADLKNVQQSIGGIGTSVEGNLGYANATASAAARAKALNDAADPYRDPQYTVRFAQDQGKIFEQVRKSTPIISSVPTVNDLKEIAKFPQGITVKYKDQSGKERYITNRGQFDAQGVTGQEIP